MTDDTLKRAYRVLTSDETSLKRLAKIAGRDPKTFYDFANLANVDLTGQDLRGIDFVGAQFNGAILDASTKIDPHQARKIKSSTMTWKPIDTAPKDVAIWAWAPGWEKPKVIWWETDLNDPDASSWATSDEFSVEPTMWAEPPAPQSN